MSPDRGCIEGAEVEEEKSRKPQDKSNKGQ
jgi:hypothetical protein